MNAEHKMDDNYYFELVLKVYDCPNSNTPRIPFTLLCIFLHASLNIVRISSCILLSYYTIIAIIFARGCKLINWQSMHCF